MTCGVAGCGRPIVRGPLGQWAHTENPGRDHHYARPASRSAAHSDLAGLGAASRDGDQPPTEGPDLGQALPSLPAADKRIPPSAAGVSDPVPTASAAASAHRLLAPARDARPDSISASDRSKPTLGLL